MKIGGVLRLFIILPEKQEYFGDFGLTEDALWPVAALQRWLPSALRPVCGAPSSPGGHWSYPGRCHVSLLWRCANPADKTAAGGENEKSDKINCGDWLRDQWALQSKPDFTTVLWLQRNCVLGWGFFFTWAAFRRSHLRFFSFSRWTNALWWSCSILFRSSSNRLIFCPKLQFVKKASPFWSLRLFYWINTWILASRASVAKDESSNSLRSSRLVISEHRCCRSHSSFKFSQSLWCKRKHPSDCSP